MRERSRDLIENISEPLRYSTRQLTGEQSSVVRFSQFQIFEINAAESYCTKFSINAEALEKNVKMFYWKPLVALKIIRSAFRSERKFNDAKLKKGKGF